MSKPREWDISKVTTDTGEWSNVIGPDTAPGFGSPDNIFWVKVVEYSAYQAALERIEHLESALHEATLREHGTEGDLYFANERINKLENQLLLSGESASREMKRLTDRIEELEKKLAVAEVVKDHAPTFERLRIAELETKYKELAEYNDGCRKVRYEQAKRIGELEEHIAGLTEALNTIASYDVPNADGEYTKKWQLLGRYAREALEKYGPLNKSKPE